MYDTLYRLYELYDEGGVPEVYRGIRDFLYYRNPFRGEVDYHAERSDNEQRWEFIGPELSEASTVIDIGCAEGFFTRKAAEAGALSIGIDNEQSRIDRARKRSNSVDGCGLVKWNVSPESIDQLPRVSVILLLTVHHHWEDTYGLNAAEQMFQTVMDRCEVLVYEPPGDRPLIKSQNGTLDPEKSMAYYTDRLRALYGDSIEIIDSRMFEHSEEFKNPREDPVFLLDVSEFRLTEDPRPETK